MISNCQQFILASASPRRRELLKQIGIEPIVIASSYKEFSKGDSIFAVVESNARGKLLDVISRNDCGDAVVISADTIVVIDDTIFGKPKNAEHAFEMLSVLSGKLHKVVTGVAIYYNNKIMYDYSTTDVYMKKLEPYEMEGYILSGEPFDKAGGYGIQSLGAVLVEKIDGCYSNVVGLPLPLLYSMLSNFGVKIL